MALGVITRGVVDIVAGDFASGRSGHRGWGYWLEVAVDIDVGVFAAEVVDHVAGNFCWGSYWTSLLGIMCCGRGGHRCWR